MRKFLAVIAAAGIALAGCTSSASVVDNNIKESADNFQVLRRVVFINVRDGSYLLEVTGWCNITDQTIQVETICKEPTGYKKHLMGIQSEWVTYLVQQEDAANVSPDFYRFSVKPTSLLPIPKLR